AQPRQIHAGERALDAPGRLLDRVVRLVPGGGAPQAEERRAQVALEDPVRGPDHAHDPDIVHVNETSPTVCPRVQFLTCRVGHFTASSATARSATPRLLSPRRGPAVEMPTRGRRWPAVCKHSAPLPWTIRSV